MSLSESASTETQQEQKEKQTVPAEAGTAVFQTEPAKPLFHDVREDTHKDPVVQYSSELSFVCLLIPRFHDHHLTGDITEYLVEWMRQVCISYGWRLDAISVRPGYLQWIMIVPLNANPAQFMRVIRRHTSEKIFEDFPRFKQMNLSGEFWAPGNFVTPGNQLQTPEVVNNFILQTRRNQGIV